MAADSMEVANTPALRQIVHLQAPNEHSIELDLTMAWEAADAYDRITVAGEPVSLTPTEFELLAIL